MAVIWGLDLKEMQWGKFKGSYMFNKTYHLRCTKMIVYQFAMILCVCSESVGTAAMSAYIDQQDGITRRNPPASTYNDDYVGIAAFNVFVGIYVATIFGSAFFFDLFWPERQETKAVRLAWKICSVLAIVMVLADAVAMTVIVATGSARITHAGSAMAAYIQSQNQHPPLEYRKFAKCIASVVLLWLGWPAVIASTYILFASHKHDDEYGPFSKIGASQTDVEKSTSEVPKSERDTENQTAATTRAHYVADA